MSARICLLCSLLYLSDAKSIVMYILCAMLSIHSYIYKYIYINICIYTHTYRHILTLILRDQMRAAISSVAYKLYNSVFIECSRRVIYMIHSTEKRELKYPLPKLS